MNKVLINKIIGRYSANKQGQRYISKRGNPFTRVVLEVDGYNAPVSLLDFRGDTANWKEGDEVELEIKEREYNGNTVYDGNIPSKGDVLERRVSELEEKMSKVIRAFQSLKKKIDKIETGKTEEENNLTEATK